MQIYIFTNVIKETKASYKFVSSTECNKEHRASCSLYIFAHHAHYCIFCISHKCIRIRINQVLPR